MRLSRLPPTAGCRTGHTAASPGSSSPASADPASVANVTLHIGDQAGAGAEALLTAAGLISKLPFKADWSDFTSGPPMLQAMAAGSVDVGTVGDAPPVFAAPAATRSPSSARCRPTRTGRQSWFRPTPQFLLKDLVLVAAALWTLGDSLGAARLRTRPAG